MNLFEDVFKGRVMDVSAETHLMLRDMFPEVDEYANYRDADAWLIANPRKRPKKNFKRFIINWFRKSAKQIAREYRKSDVLRAEINVGAGPELRRNTQ